MAAVRFIVNPASGMGKTGRQLDKLREQATGLDAEWLVTPTVAKVVTNTPSISNTKLPASGVPLSIASVPLTQKPSPG